MVIGYSGLSRTIKDLGLASDMPIEVDYVVRALPIAAYVRMP